ncbi:MAG: CsbD family protein [Solirubrobacterales bacterium]
MGDNIDEAKGRVKEAAGDLSDDQDLKNEGRVDKAVSDVKEKVDDIADKVKDRIGGRDKDADTDADRT